MFYLQNSAYEFADKAELFGKNKRLRVTEAIM